MFETIFRNIHRACAEFDWQMANCNDVYRLAHITNTFQLKMAQLNAEATELVRELEEVDI